VKQQSKKKKKVPAKRKSAALVPMKGGNTEQAGVIALCTEIRAILDLEALSLSLAIESRGAGSPRLLRE